MMKKNRGKSVDRGRRRNRNHMEHRLQSSFRRGMNSSLARQLAGRTKRGGRWRRVGLAPCCATSCRVPIKAWTENVVVQFQYEEKVELNQDSQPDRPPTTGATSPKNGFVFETDTHHASKPARRRRPSPPGCREPDSQRIPGAEVKSVLPQ